ncbi:MAG: OadG family protein [Eubacteriales bacterium]|nr:OadG family protein [Eubacteriales bacterium]
MIDNIVSLSGSAATEMMTTGESLGLGGSVTLLSVSVVFLALISLIVITMFYPKIALAQINTAAKLRSNKKTVLPDKGTATVKMVDIAATATQTTDDKQFVAVIAAAVASSLGTSSNGVVIRSVKRSTSHMHGWGQTGRQEQVYNRF